VCVVIISASEKVKKKISKEKQNLTLEKGFFFFRPEK
jgi:hypothetical protein